MKDMKVNKQELSVEKMENISGGGDSKGKEKDSKTYDQNNSNNSGIQLNTQEGDSINNGAGGIVLNK